MITATTSVHTVADTVVRAEAASVDVGGTRLLDAASLAIHPGELVAIVGASGAGKTTLLELLAGLRQPASGTVSVAGGSLGYVPQDDIVHRDLTVGTTVTYAARLRLPARTAPAEIAGAVSRTLDLLGLRGRRHQSVGSLSGGQRKRVSIATELVVQPRICFLDEPTAGLDPPAAAELVRLLRALADDGTAIVMTTHNLADLDVADRLVVVGGGRIAYDGVPRPLDQGAWSAPAEPDRPTAPAAPAAPAARAPRAPRARPRRPAWAQLRVLTRRNVELLLRNRMSLAIMAGSPLLVVGMFAVLFRPDAFAPDAADGTAAIGVTYWLAFAGFFFGLTFGLLQICTELEILRRERLVTVDLGPYLLAKLAVLTPALAAVNLAMLVTLSRLHRLPALGAGGAAKVLGLLLLDSLAGLTLGLAASATVSSAAQAALALPMLCFPAVLFSGAVLPLVSMTSAGRGIAAAMSDRWAFEALARAMTLGAAPVGSARRYAVDLHGGALSGPIAGHAAVLVLLAAALLAGARVILARRTR